MARGRKPKPTKLKILEGNPGKRPLNDREPMPNQECPTCPRWLHPLAKVEWKRVIIEMEEMGTLARCDRAIISVLCQAVAEFQLTTEAMGKDISGRMTTRGTGGIAVHPLVSLQSKAMRTIKDCSAVLGLDPSSRTRLRTPDAGEDDELAAFLRSSRKKQQ